MRPTKKNYALVAKFEVTVVLLLFVTGIFVSCSGTSDEGTSRPDENNGGAQVDSTLTGATPGADEATVFTVIGDVPYNAEQKEGLINFIDNHNSKSRSEFVVHVGDIKPGGDACDEGIYQEVSEILGDFETPTFIVLGDNEYNDCDDPEDALSLWNTYFLDFHDNWDFPHTVIHQEKRPENFAWVENAVLFLGLNLVGSSVHDQVEWDKRLTDNAEWVEEQFELYKNSIETAVLFGHANITDVGPEKFQRFTDRFRAAGKVLNKPILYMQGDGHFWLQNRPWPEQNIVRVQIEGGAKAVQVKVDPKLEEPFVFDRAFLD